MERPEKGQQKTQPAKINQDDFAKFMNSHKGAVLRPDDEGYENAREIWNAMIDRRPAIIARCMDVSDIELCLDFAKRQKLVFSVRGGGHNIAGNALCDDGLMIDLSQMTNVRVDPNGRRAHVQPGALLRDLDRETQKFGLAIPLGINSTTGVAGLTLGGGFGWLSRKHGLTVDSLLSVEILVSDGRLLRANEHENPDLFWAVRGGGGNFGIVTDFEFQLHPIGPDVLCGLIVFPLDEIQTVLGKYSAFVRNMPDELSIWAVIRKAPPLPFLAPQVHGKEIVALAICYAGDPEKGRKLIDPVFHFGKPLGHHVGVQPYSAWQQAFDPLLAYGFRNYWKSHNFSVLSDDAIKTIETYAKRLPSDNTEIFLGLLGGAVSRIPADATAYPHRDALFAMNVHGRWSQPADDAFCVSWAREFFKAAEPFSTGGVYVNFLTQDEKERIHSAYGKNYVRLTEIKAKYDPSNLFRINQNLKPKTEEIHH